MDHIPPPLYPGPPLDHESADPPPPYPGPPLDPLFSTAAQEPGSLNLQNISKDHSNVELPVKSELRFTEIHKREPKVTVISKSKQKVTEIHKSEKKFININKFITQNKQRSPQKQASTHQLYLTEESADGSQVNHVENIEDDILSLNIRVKENPSSPPVQANSQHLHHSYEAVQEAASPAVYSSVSPTMNQGMLQPSAQVVHQHSQPAMVLQSAASQTVIQPAAQPAVMMQPAAQPTVMIQCPAQPTVMMQPAAQPACMMQPAAQPTVMIQRPTQPTVMMQPAAQPTVMIQRPVQPTVMIQPQYQYQPTVIRTTVSPGVTMIQPTVQPSVTVLQQQAPATYFQSTANTVVYRRYY